jgi:uncharacterized protein (TIGR02246 family)
MAKSSTWLTMVLVAGVVGTVAIGAAQQRSATGKAPVLTPQDQVEIEQLVARYAYAYDSGADNCFAYADLFTPDGEFIGTRGHAKGRDALADYCRGARKPTIGVSHFIMNQVVEPTADGVTGKQYLIVVNIGENNQPGGEFSNTGGHYEDVYAKTAQGWRFKRREYIPIKAAPRPSQAAR